MNSMIESQEIMEGETSEVKGIPLPDARTAYQLRRVKDKVIGAATAWDIIQPEYWPLFEIMENISKSSDRNGAAIHWLMKNQPDQEMRNETWRRVELAFQDPDRESGPNSWTDKSYFDSQGELSPIVWALDVVEREIEWLWPGRIPQGKLVTLAGPGGVGKSFLLCDMAARVSAGLSWPFSEDQAPQGNVLIISGEDEIEDTIRPRLRLQGADLGRVAFPSSVELLGFNLSGPRFKDVADRMLQAMDGASLLIIDPPSSFLAGIDENSNAEVRGFLTPMKEWAHANNCCVIFNTHVNKASGKKLDIQQRVIGSVAMVNGPRMSHMVVASEDDPDVKLFVPLKSNIWQRLQALSFRIVPDLHEVKHARLDWVAQVDIDAGTAMNGRDHHSSDQNGGEEEDTKEEKIETWLIDRFKEKPIWTSKEISERLEADLGFRVGSAFQRVKDEIGIKSRRYGKQWEMFVSDDWAYAQY
jgi:hypothetical protein